MILSLIVEHSNDSHCFAIEWHHVDTVGSIVLRRLLMTMKRNITFQVERSERTISINRLAKTFFHWQTRRLLISTHHLGEQSNRSSESWSGCDEDKDCLRKNSERSRRGSMLNQWSSTSCWRAAREDSFIVVVQLWRTILIQTLFIFDKTLIFQPRHDTVNLLGWSLAYGWSCRFDTLVKINVYRIELSEIEHLLRTYPNVQRVVV